MGCDYAKCFFCWNLRDGERVVVNAFFLFGRSYVWREITKRQTKKKIRKTKNESLPPQLTYGTNVCFDGFLWSSPSTRTQTNWKARDRFPFVWLRRRSRLRDTV